jgi:hypothetical protein
MDAIKPINAQALIRLKAYRGQLSPQQYKTLRGQILAGDAEGAARGLEKILERRRSRDNTTRQSPGNSDRQQPKD